MRLVKGTMVRVRSAPGCEGSVVAMSSLAVQAGADTAPLADVALMTYCLVAVVVCVVVPALDLGVVDLGCVVLAPYFPIASVAFPRA